MARCLSLVKYFTILHFKWNFRKFNPHWQSGGIIIFLFKYYIIISDWLVGSFLNVLFSLLAVRLSDLYEKLTKKKEFFFSFLDARRPFYVNFSCSPPPPPPPLPKWRTHWMGPIKIHNIVMGGILCNGIMSERLKIWKSLAI